MTKRSVCCSLVAFSWFALVESHAAQPAFDISAEASDSVSARAFTELAAGRLDRAYALFNAAAMFPTGLTPNITPFLYMGVSKCLSGDLANAVALLDDYMCMAKVATGQRECPPSAFSPDLEGVPKEKLGGLTLECARTMCIERLRQAYKSPSKDVVQAADIGLKLASLMKGRCSK